MYSVSTCVCIVMASKFAVAGLYDSAQRVQMQQQHVRLSGSQSTLALHSVAEAVCAVLLLLGGAYLRCSDNTVLQPVAWLHDLPYVARRHGCVIILEQSVMQIRVERIARRAVPL